jgi:hypothetical protein
LPADAVAERAAAAPPSSELAPPETAEAADDRLFDLDLEPLAAEAGKEVDPRFSVHPEDLDETASGVTATTPGDAGEVAIVEAEAPVEAEATETAETTDETAVAAGETPDVLEGWDLEPVEAEPPPPTIPPVLPAAEVREAERARSTNVDGVTEVELEPLPEPAEPAAESATAEPVADATAAAARQATPEAAPQPEAPTPQAQAQPQPPPTPPAQPRRPGPVEAFNWGANQEHFFGGMPLNLGGAPGRTPQQPQPARPVQQPQRPAAQQGQPAPAARQPQQQQRPPQRPQPPQQQQFPQRPQPQQGQRGRPSPFADGGRGVASGFEGLAIPPVNETDVFGQVPGSLTAGFDPSLMNDVFGGGAGIGRNNKAAAGGGGGGARTMPTPQPGANNNAGGPTDVSARPPASMRATKAEPPGDSWTGSGPLSGDVDQTDPSAVAAQQAARPLPSAQEAPPPPAKKKRRWFGLRVLVPFALLSMAAAGAGIYYFIPVKSSVAGVLKFENFEKLPQHNRREFVKPQLALLTDENRTLRDAAKRRLAALDKTVTGGFLDDSLAYAKVATSPEFDIEAGTLSLRYVGGAGKADQDRMLALLQAMYDRNKPLIDETNGLTRTVESLTREREVLERSMKDMKARIDELATAAQQKPDVAERTRLEAEAKRLETAWKAAVANATRLATELKQLRENPAPVPAPPATPAPAAAPAANVSPAAAQLENDPTLQQLQSQLQQVDAKLVAVQEARGMTAQAARQKLEAAAASLREQLQQAQAAAQNHPELFAYLTRAQETLQRVGVVTEELAARQHQQLSELAQVKQLLDEKMQARRAEMAKKDPELVKLMDQRDFRMRQHNAAVGQGLTKEAADLKVELSALDTEIAARQTMVADDGAHADEINQLQQVADATQKDLEADRAGVLQQIEQMQQEAAAARPADEKLSASQQAVAKETDTRLAAVGAAGRQYASSADTANKATDDDVRTLQASAAELVNKIQARKQELAAQLAAAPAAPAPAADAPPASDPQATIEQKQGELAAAEKASADAEAAYFAANKKVHDLKERLEQARAAGEKRDALVRQRDIAQQNLDQLVNQYELKKKLAEQQAFPAEPTPASVKVDDKGDPRPMYTLIACGAIAAMCVGLGFITTSGGSADDAMGYASMYGSYENDPNQTVAYEDEDAHHRATPVEA